MAAKLAIVALAILIVIIGPITTIWAWNTLFPQLPIALTFETWTAVLLLGFFFRASVTK